MTGAAIERPSERCTVNVSSDTSTSTATGRANSFGEVLMPRFQQGCLLLRNDTPDSAQLGRAEAQTVIVLERIEPELSNCVVPRDMNMRRFSAVRRVEEEPIRASS